MEALSKIGEFFFDDGLPGEEERLGAYKEKVRNTTNNNNNNKRAGTSQTNNQDDTAAKKNAGPASSTRGRSTATRTTGTSVEAELVSTTESVSSSHSEDSTSSDLESMIPETVCADLSFRSVSSKSVISESATDSSSTKGDQYSTSDSKGSNSREESGSGTERSDVGRGSRSRSRSASARKNNRVRSHGSEPTSRSPRQLRPDKRVLVAIKKGRTRSLYSRFIGNSFKLGARSASTTTKQDAEAGTDTDIGVGCDDTTAFDQLMVDQLIELIRSRDDEDDSDDSRSTSSSQSSHSHTSSSSPRGTVTSGNSAGTSEASDPKERKGKREYSPTSPKSKPNLPVAITAVNSHPGFETVSEVGSGAVRSAKSTISLKSMNTKSTKSRTIHGWIEENVTEDETCGDRIELAITSSSECDGDDEEVLKTDTTSETDAAKPESPPRSKSPVSAQKMSAKPISIETTDTKQRSIKSLFQPRHGKKTITQKLPKASAKSNASPGLPLPNAKKRLPQQVPKASAKSNAWPGLPTINSSSAGSTGSQKATSRTAASVECKGKKTAGTAAMTQHDIDNGIKAFREAMIQKANTTVREHEHKAVVSSRARSLPVKSSTAMEPSPPTTHQLKTTGQFFTTNLMLDDPNPTPPNNQSQTESLLKRLQSPTQSKDAAAESIVASPKSRPSPKGSALQQTSTTICRDPSDVSHQLQSVRNGIVVTASSNGSTSRLIQDGTMESSTSVADLQEFIEVTYESVCVAEENPIASRADTQHPTPPIFSSGASHMSPEEADDANPFRSNEDNVQGAGIAEQELSEEERPTPSLRKRKSFFGSRLLQRNKDKADAAPTTEAAPIEATQARHSKDAAIPQDRKESLPLSINKNTREDASEVAARQTSAPTNDALASNGFMRAIERLQVEAESANVATPAKDNKTVDQLDFQGDQTDNLRLTQECTRKSRLNLFAAKSKRRGSNSSTERLDVSFRPIEAEREKEEAGPDSPSRKKWVRSLGVSRKRREQAKTAQRSKEESSNRKPQAANLGLEGRLPSTLPLPQGRRVVVDGATEPCIEGTGGTFNSYENPWQIGHPNYNAGQECPERLPIGYGAHRPQADKGDLKHALSRRLLLESEAIQMQHNQTKSFQEQKPPIPLEKLETVGNKPNAVDLEPNKQTKPKPKTGLSKLKSGFKGMMRWNENSQKRNDSGQSLDVLRAQANEDEPPHADEEVTGPFDSNGPDKTFLMQHQMMMQSRYPTWKQPVLTTTPKAGVAKGRRAGRRSKETPHSHEFKGDQDQAQTKLQRVLGKREKTKKTQHTDSTANSILEPRIPDQNLEQNLQKILQSLSSTSSSASSRDTYSNDGTQDYTYDGTLDGTLGTDADCSVQNQRVLDTLRLLHAVKRKKKKDKPKQSCLAMRKQDCNENLIGPLIDEIEQAACGIRF